jgi:rare lipoprotein A
MKKIVVALALISSSAFPAVAAEVGFASYYSYPQKSGLIAAHRTLPFGSQVRVTNLNNGRTTVVRIIDRGPFVRGRIIDVSVSAAAALGFTQAGVARVRLDRL